MHLIVLNHKESAGINGFHTQAILTKHLPNDLGGTALAPGFISVEGFITSPGIAIRAARGEDIRPSNYSKRSQKEIDKLISEYFNTEAHKFLIPVSGIAYIENIEG